MSKYTILKYDWIIYLHIKMWKINRKSNSFIFRVLYCKFGTRPFLIKFLSFSDPKFNYIFSTNKKKIQFRLWLKNLKKLFFTHINSIKNSIDVFLHIYSWHIILYICAQYFWVGLSLYLKLFYFKFNL